MAAHRSSTKARAARRLPVLALALAAAGCSGPVSFDRIGSSVEEMVGGLTSPFTGSRGAVVADSLTIQRVRGTNPEVAPLLPEPGNVWPEPEAPRPTLLSGPDEAMRNIPDYRPSLIADPASPAASPVATPGVGRPPQARRGSTTPPAPLGAPGEPARATVTPPLVPPGPPPRNPQGRVTTSPSGQPAIITNEAGRIRGVTQPGVGGGAVIRDGNVETWIGPDGRSHSRIVTD